MDIYSLGIIFFEMCHKPFDTEAERRGQLAKIRESDFVLPLNSALSMQEVNNSSNPSYKHIDLHLTYFI